jgi:hypothetical protein
LLFELFATFDIIQKLIRAFSGDCGLRRLEADPQACARTPIIQRERNSPSPPNASDVEELVDGRRVKQGQTSLVKSAAYTNIFPILALNLPLIYGQESRSFYNCALRKNENASASASFRRRRAEIRNAAGRSADEQSSLK